MLDMSFISKTSFKRCVQLLYGNFYLINTSCRFVLRNKMAKCKYDLGSFKGGFSVNENNKGQKPPKMSCDLMTIQKTCFPE